LDTKRPAFVSYARADSAFAQRLAADLKTNGANVWLDQLDIRPGRQWDREVEEALTACSEMLVVLSPAATDSNNVMDEVGFALEERKTVIPVLYAECRIPLRLRRVQYIDFRSDYQLGLQALMQTLALEHQATKPSPPLSRSRVSETARKADQQRIWREEAEGLRNAAQERLQREGTEPARKAEQGRPQRGPERVWSVRIRRWVNGEGQLVIGILVAIAGFLILTALLRKG
jgi:hypothetical protein